MLRFLVICAVVVLSQATEVKRCDAGKPFPLEVRVKGCEVPPCDIVKGTNVEMEIEFVTYKHVTTATTLVKAKTFGVTVPYELPDEVKDVCSNLMYGAYCPLYPTEDVTYFFLFPVSANYPEISVNIEIYLENQDGELLTCFKCDIKVKKGNAGGSKFLTALNSTAAINESQLN
ncbi:NPC intracellular cholesterol transporter 2 homolog a [Stomoxys calcitrans]|uniref:MD-2-related lipid-recognition domain-containing protein n=1 Tax=Stomoxys calcitrans TaxID=35570 RepID=A0A1I8QE17_STOCA|nr:NPC intracellular cholesterol transporter 2 homolog a [Stomoxys calcitrans]